jgi:O-antigen ligase
MHFSGITPLVLYAAAILCGIWSIAGKPIVGFYYLVPLLPLQTLRYRLLEYPLGGSIVGLILVAMAIGVLRQRSSILPKTPWTRVISVYSIFLLISLILGAFYLDMKLPLPGTPRFGIWEDYMMMPAMLLMLAAVRPTRLEMRIIIILMCASTLLLSKSYFSVMANRDFSTYSEDREAGSMGYAGSNGLAAYEAQITVFLVALAVFEKKILPRLALYGIAALSSVCLMFTLSRGGYLALLAGWFFLGVAKKRSLLVLLAAFLLTWSTIVPEAVRYRVFMTYDQENKTVDHSAETRLDLWDDAMHLFASNPATGTGFATYAFMHRIGGYEDTHNYFLKILVETGVVGMLFFLWLLGRTFFSGLWLFWTATDPFFKALGLGLACWMVSCVVANCFGDRWSFLQVNGYMWIIAGMVAHGLTVESAKKAAEVPEAVEDHAEALVLAAV